MQYRYSINWAHAEYIDGVVHTTPAHVHSLEVEITSNTINHGANLNFVCSILPLANSLGITHDRNSFGRRAVLPAVTSVHTHSPHRISDFISTIVNELYGILPPCFRTTSLPFEDVFEKILSTLLGYYISPVSVSQRDRENIVRTGREQLRQMLIQHSRNWTTIAVQPSYSDNLRLSYVAVPPNDRYQEELVETLQRLVPNTRLHLEAIALLHSHQRARSIGARWTADELEAAITRLESPQVVMPNIDYSELLTFNNGSYYTAESFDRFRLGDWSFIASNNERREKERLERKKIEEEANRRAKDLFFSAFPDVDVSVGYIEFESKHIPYLKYQLTIDRDLIRVYYKATYIGWLCQTVLAPKEDGAATMPLFDRIFTRAVLLRRDDAITWKESNFWPDSNAFYELLDLDTIVELRTSLTKLTSAQYRIIDRAIANKTGNGNSGLLNLSKSRFENNSTIRTTSSYRIDFDNSAFYTMQDINVGFAASLVSLPDDNSNE